MPPSTARDPEYRKIILVINPGSTSTKLSLYEMSSDDIQELEGVNISHSADELNRFTSIAQQREYRSSAVNTFLAKAWKQQGLDDTGELSAVIGRGGLLAPLAGGVYEVNAPMIEDLSSGRYGEHASNLGGIIAADVAESAPGRYSRPGSSAVAAFIADPVVVDELMDEARPSGLPGLDRKSIFHALNQKACARKVAAKLKRRYQDCNFIVAHLGGGISVGAHRQGKVVDVNNALDGDGPFSPERSGGLPAGQLMEKVIQTYAAEGKIPDLNDPVHRALKKSCVGRGGLLAYLGHSDLRLIEEDSRESADNDGEYPVEQIINGMIHQIAKEISQHGATLRGDIDGIILTGGLAHSTRIIRGLESRLSWLSGIFVLPGEGEMDALAENAYSVLKGERTLAFYTAEASAVHGE